MSSKTVAKNSGASPKIYSRYDRPPQFGLDTGSDSIVDQSQKDLCDINILYDRYTNEGSGLPVNNRPIYGDFSQPYTLQDVFDLRNNLDTLYSRMSDDYRKNTSFVQFVDKLTTADNDSIYSMFNPDSSKVGNTLSQPPAEKSAGDSSVSSPGDATSDRAT